MRKATKTPAKAMLEISNTQEYGLRNRSVAKRDLKSEKINKKEEMTSEMEKTA